MPVERIIGLLIAVIVVIALLFVLLRLVSVV